MSKRLSTILRREGSDGREAKEVPTPYGGVYRRQNQTEKQPNPYKRHGAATAYQRSLTVHKDNRVASKDISAVLRKSNKAGRQTRRVLSASGNHLDQWFCLRVWCCSPVSTTLVQLALPRAARPM